jgi:hypothetical protein
MAKDKENKQQAPKPAVVDADNISTVVRNNNVPTVDITKNVYEQIGKERDERLTEQIKNRALKSEYMRRRKLLQLRARRRENDITKEYLQKAEVLQYQMAGFQLTDEHVAKMGGKDGKVELEIVVYKDGEPTKEKKTFEVKKNEETWVPASITCTEFDDLCEKLKDEESKARAKCDADLRKDLLELEAQYPGYFSYSWRW